jgi:hypothetical protein
MANLSPEFPAFEQIYVMEKKKISYRKRRSIGLSSNRRKTIKRLCVLAGLMGILAVPAVQAQMQVTLYQDLNNYSFSDGGEFYAVANAALLAVNPALAGYAPATADLTAGNPNFQTFCIETGEYFTPGDTYNVTISAEVLYDGGQFPNGEPITMGTAWLYSQFAAGTLSGYDYAYGYGRTITAGDLQQAIWYLQGEQPGLVNVSGADGTAFYNAAVLALGGVAAVNNPANGAYGVVALNLWVPNEDGSNGAAAQDQLMVVPEPSTVPEPSAVSFGLLLLLLLGLSKVRASFGKQTV